MAIFIRHMAGNSSFFINIKMLNLAGFFWSDDEASAVRGLMHLGRKGTEVHTIEIYPTVLR